VFLKKQIDKLNNKIYYKKVLILNGFYNQILGKGEKMSYAIGSFNMFKWGKDSNKDFDLLYRIIKKEEFDIIALQEVFAEEAVENLCKHLNPLYWDYCVDFPKGSQNHEGYAFVWKKRRLHLSNSLRNDNPKIVEKYKTDKGLGISCLRRPPYYARFTPNNLPRVEIRLINTHIRFNKVKTDSVSGATQRYHEFRILAEDIMARISNQPEFNRDFYTVLLGDYNLKLCQINNEMPILIDSRFGFFKKHVVTVQNDLTTLSNDQNTNIIYANDYDHFTYNEESFNRLSSFQVQRIDVVSKYLNSDREKYKNTISDHIPIKLTLNLK